MFLASEVSKRVGYPGVHNRVPQHCIRVWFQDETRVAITTEGIRVLGEEIEFKKEEHTKAARELWEGVQESEGITSMVPFAEEKPWEDPERKILQDQISDLEDAISAKDQALTKMIDYVQKIGEASLGLQRAWSEAYLED